ncbi:MAG: PrsW family glutamic-type intramembrane protease [Verrucomicrobiota bacterium]
MVGAVFIGTFLPLVLLMLLLRHSRPVFASFCWGMLAFLLVYVTSPTLYRILGIDDVIEFTAVFVGPPYEEFLKALPLVVAAVFAQRSLIPFFYILGMASGIGFSIEENLNFLIRFHQNDGDSMTLMILRSFSTCLMHGVATGLIGYSLTLAKRRKGLIVFLFPAIGWSIATFYHAFFNWLMLQQQMVIGLLIALIAFFALLFIMKQVEGKAPEVQGTIWQ